MLSQNLAATAEGPAAAALPKEAPKHQNARKVRSPSEKRFERRFGSCGSHLAKAAGESRKFQYWESWTMEEIESNAATNYKQAQPLNVYQKIS